MDSCAHFRAARWRHAGARCCLVRGAAGIPDARMVRATGRGKNFCLSRARPEKKIFRSMNASTSIVWFRQDLRLADNPALQAAVQPEGTVVPVFIYAPDEE